jgi:hypothetical protein
MGTGRYPGALVSLSNLEKGRSSSLKPNSFLGHRPQGTIMVETVGHGMSFSGRIAQACSRGQCQVGVPGAGLMTVETIRHFLSPISFNP